MSLLQAFQETLAGKEDRAGITAVDVYTSQLLESGGYSQQDKFNEVQKVICTILANSERKWFMLTGVIAKWGLTSEALSESIRSKLADHSEPLPSAAQYHALRAMGAAAGGLLPVDVVNEQELRQDHPKLWAELVLSAYQNGNPAQITEHLVSLLAGNTPLMPWQSLRALLPEMRLAYGSAAELRKQIQVIASKLADPDARKGILDAAEKRVGGGISSSDVVDTQKKTANTKQFNIPPTPIERDINYSRKYVESDGQLTLATG